MPVSAMWLLGCFEVPGWGGASTITYTDFARLQRDGIDVRLVNLIDAGDADMLRGMFGDTIGNPSGLNGVRNCVLDAPLFQAQARLADIIAAEQPDLMVARGYIAAWLMRKVAPKTPLAFITSGAWHIKQLLHEGAIDDFVDFQRRIARGMIYPLPETSREWAVVTRSDLIILHSPLVRTAFEHFYPAHMGKVYANLISIADGVYAEAERFSAYALPFAQRDIDAIFIASNWRRPEKNFPLLRRIAVACEGLNMHVVGAGDPERLPVQWHGVVTRREDVYTLLGRAKTIVCPSAWDPAPGVLFEASAMGCNVVASPNCGNWQLCHDELLADSPGGFVDAVRRAISAPYEDQRQRFRGGYADLVDTLSEFF